MQWISVNKTNHAIRWIVIYPVDSAIRFSNNRGQGCKVLRITLAFFEHNSAEIKVSIMPE